MRTNAYGNDISTAWRLLIVGMDGRISAILTPDRIAGAGSAADFSLPISGDSDHGMRMAIIQDERGIERGRGMLPAVGAIPKIR